MRGTHSLTDRVVRVLATALVVAIMVRSAWIVDDALITLRTALNITHGFGPGFNGTEAVQAYTHPLWFLSWVSIGSLTDQWILGILFFSVLVAALALGILIWRSRSLTQVIVITALFAFSNALVEYSTSGLEGPLGWLFIALLIVLTQRWINDRLGTSALVLILTGVSAAGLFLTRFDLILIAAPALLFVLWNYRRNSRALLTFLGVAVIPLLIWFTWSWMTYATFLPNTFSAKRNLNIPATELIIQGFRYFWVSFEYDPASFVLMVIGISVGLFSGVAVLRAWAIGAIVYLGYVFFIGGDFMAGRFFTPILFVSLALIAFTPIAPLEKPSSQENNRVLIALAGVSLILIALIAANTRPSSLSISKEVRWQADQNSNAGVDDARAISVGQGKDLEIFLDQLSLAYTNPDFVPVGNREGLNRTLRELSKSAQNWPVNDGWFTTPSEVSVWCGFMGNVGIATGPTVHLIDDCALSDRFLAQKPFGPTEPFAWKMGHFHRVIPEGYEEAVLFNDPSRLADPADAFFLEELWSTIRSGYATTPS